MRYCLLLLFCLASAWGYAQENGRFPDPLNIKVPPGRSDSATGPGRNLPPKTGRKDTLVPGTFRPVRNLTVVSEDTSSLADGEMSVVEVSEEVRIDCVWVKVADYYTIWDSRHVNPYGIAAGSFRDTLPIQLYDEQHHWAFPLRETFVTSNFGYRGYRWHYGTDLELDTGDSVRAAFDGIVRVRHYEGGGFGNYVVLRHLNGFETVYGHLSRHVVVSGQEVKAGDLIGLGGSTGRSSGPHLHYEVRYQGNPINSANIYDLPKLTPFSDVFVLLPSHFSYVVTAKQAAAAARKAYYHRVRSGDTLGAIAHRYGVSVSYLCRLNRISARSLLRLGQRLRVR